MQLLQVTITKPRYELEIEHARLEYKQNFQPRANVQTTPPELKIETENTKLRLDTYEARKSLGFLTIGDRIKEAGRHSQEAFNKEIRETVEMGEQLSNIHEGVTIKDIISQKALRMPEMYTAFLPSSRAQVSWEPNQIQMKYTKGNVNYDWEDKSNSMSYVPGSVRLNIIERGKIEVDYLGSPIYFPRSADPNYEEPAVS